MIKYKVEQITPKENEKGTSFKDDITGRTKLSFLTRKKGIVSGKHYHEGKPVGNMPENVMEKQSVSAGKELDFKPHNI